MPSTAQLKENLLLKLSVESSTERLLEKIVIEAQQLTHADGGTLYLLVGEDKKAELKFSYMRNDSLDIIKGGCDGSAIPYPNIQLYQGQQPNFHNISAFTALTKTTVNIDNAYQQDTFDFSGTLQFDQAMHYHTQSVLSVPLCNHENDVIGVLQLVNAIDQNSGHVIPFDIDLEPIIEALASYAAIALNNKILLQDHKNLLDAFVKCIAKAIDAKSTHTSAHCQRVPVLTQMLAEAACDTHEGYLQDFNLNEAQWYELQVAAWLHDCGKLSTPDSLLDKSTKLHLLQDGIEAIQHRFHILQLQLERNTLQQSIQTPEQTAQYQQQLQSDIERLQQECQFVSDCNRGSEFMSPEYQHKIKQIAQQCYTDAQGNTQPLLTTQEVDYLCISKGTLSQQERNIINHHMQVTIDMLESLPFPKHLRQVPEYAGGHHEKMDGSGFPKGLTREQMSIPARIMAIADIFEALTAKERPYKQPMKVSQALRIMQAMKRDQHIDPDIFNAFVSNKVWLRYAERFLQPEQCDLEDGSEYLN